MRKSIKILTTLAAAVLIFIRPTASLATVTTYTSVDDFNAALLSGSYNTYTETFDSLSTAAPLDPVLNFSQSGLSYQAATTFGGEPDQFFAAAHGSDIYLSTNNDKDTVTFTMQSTNIQAIGGYFFLTDIDGLNVANSVSVSVDSGPAQILELVSPSSFVGFISTDPLSSLQIVEYPTSQSGDYLTINNFTVAAPIPEPSTVAGLVFGFGLVAGCARRKGMLRTSRKQA